MRKKMNTTQDARVKRCPEKAMKLKINSDCTKYCCYVFIWWTANWFWMAPAHHENERRTCPPPHTNAGPTEPFFSVEPQFLQVSSDGRYTDWTLRLWYPSLEDSSNSKTPKTLRYQQKSDACLASITSSSAALDEVQTMFNPTASIHIYS